MKDRCTVVNVPNVDLFHTSVPQPLPGLRLLCCGIYSTANLVSSAQNPQRFAIASYRLITTFCPRRRRRLDKQSKPACAP